MTYKKLIKWYILTVLLSSSYNLASNRTVEASEDVSGVESSSTPALEIDNNAAITSSMLIDADVNTISKVDSYYSLYSSLYSSITEKSKLRDDVLFSISAISTNWGVNGKVDTNNYFPTISVLTATSFEESYTLFIDELNDLSVDFNLSHDQTLEEQAKILQEIYQANNLESTIIEISEFYHSRNISEEVVGESALSSEVVEEVQNFESSSPDTTVNSEIAVSEGTGEQSVVQSESVNLNPTLFRTASLMFSMDTPTTYSATKLHKVKTGETLYRISQGYNVTVQQLKDWNYLSSDTIRVGQFLGVNGYYDDSQILFNSEQEFLSAILPDAKRAAEEFNLYTSVMLAQAILESSYGNSELAKISNNILGIKYLTSNYVEKATLEYKDDAFYESVEKFEKYDSYKDAIISYSNKIRNGVSWNSVIYKGVWPENTATYKDATLALTGVYAGDPTYNAKLNAIIERLNLTRYDNHIIKKMI